MDAWVTDTLGVFVAEVLIRAIYRAIRRDKAPEAVFDPDNRQFSWPDAAVWAIAGGLGTAAAKIASARLARVGWKLATGSGPPRGDERTENPSPT